MSEHEEDMLFVAINLHYIMIIVESQAIPPIYKLRTSHTPTQVHVYFSKFQIHWRLFPKISSDQTRVIALKAEEVLKVLA